ncbi:hypothetical protein [Sideroxydans sp. CL21]|uniref:hypothetical protein n=1 Tax=Sideroxydans sp. CL21 TaxID=2600596 RepID=UPI0024BD0AAA|nr:hypothetical protein [Sideroxydans sp. CL21]
MVLAIGVFVSTAHAQPAQAEKSSAPVKMVPVVATPTRYLPNRLPKRARMYFGGIWGVDSLRIKRVESGEIIRFSWRVLDADKAKELNDKKAEPALIDPQARVSLVVPSLEQVGQLRQSAPPEAGKSYWMAFSNQGRLVKRGDRVSVLIGQFRADGLVVE